MKPDWQTQDGRIQLYCGDCLKILPEIGKVDAVIADPPYGVGISYKGYDDTKENLLKLIEPFLFHIKNCSIISAIFTGVMNTEYWTNADWRACWACPAGTGMGKWGFTCWTPIALYGKDPYLKNRMGGRPDIFVDYNPKAEDENHPVVKPLSVIFWLINRISLQHDELICDPFMGSGTTGIACIRTKRRFIGIEISPEYFEIARKRIEIELQQGILDL